MAEDADNRFQPVRDWIRAELTAQAFPSLAVAVAQAGRILWEEGFGWADREKRLPADAHTPYSLASISKPITATGMMILKQQGKLELDQPLNACLGEAKINGRAFDAEQATVRRVANHTSGLPLHYHFFYADEPFAPPPREETIRRYASLMFAPGERYQYSNLGYGLFDHAIERLSGKSYAGFLREEVFLPLGMTRASVHIGPGLEPYAAARYGGDGIAYPFYDFDHPGGSAVFCSARDLLRFGMFHLKNRLPDQKAILSEEAIAEMQADTVGLPDAPAYGFGWGVNSDRAGYRIVGHGGGMGGVSTRLELLPDADIAVVALANAGGTLPFRAVDEILSALLPDYREKLAAQRAKREEEKASAPKPEFAPDADLLGEWRGGIHAHQGEIPLTLRFQPDGDVHAQVGNQLKTLLNATAFEKDWLTGALAGDIGTEDANRRPYRLHLDLKRRGDLLNGATEAVSWQEAEEGGAPGRRMGNALVHWTELKRVGT